jgi:glycosyltransferase involved in cell wall biosynthesis
MNPKISVVMPVFNGEIYMEKSIDSVLAQTFTDFEFIIVDDGSKDKTPEILERYALRDDRVRIYSNQKNLGIVDSLNAGLERASALYVARMDADDVCRRSRLAAQYEFLENNPDYVLVGTQANLIDGAGAVKGETQLPLQDADIRNELFYGRNVLFHSTIMFRNDHQDLYRKYAYPAEDYDLWLRLLRKGKAHILNERLMDYRLNPGGISFLNAVRQVELTQKIRNKVLLGIEMDDAGTASLAPDGLKKIYAKLLKRSSDCKKHSVEWFLMKALMVLLSPSELTRMKAFRWLEKYRHRRDYDHFVYGWGEETAGEAIPGRLD